MRKSIIGVIVLFSSITVYALTNNFSFDSSKLSFTLNGKKNNIVSSFNKGYNLSYSISSDEEKLKEEITNLSKKATYLLLGDVNNTNETSDNYFKRHKEYLELRYNPTVPKDANSFLGLDENSQEYKDDLLSGISVPGMFLKLDELNVTYSSIGNIRFAKTNTSVISCVSLPNVKMREENETNPLEYKVVETNLIMYYYFKKLGDQYKLLYLTGETTDNLSDYFNDLESTEGSGKMAIVPSYTSDASNIYNYSKLEAMSKNDFNKIYNSNVNNVVVLNSYYNNYVISSANGFFINDGLVVTTWDFLEKSLSEAQYITIKDNNDNNYIIDGIVTANPETDVAVIKLKAKTGNKIVLGDYTSLNVEDPVVTISSKTGVGLTIRSGILISNDGYLQSALPLSQADEGSPLLNAKGEVVGLNTEKSINTSISLAINSSLLKEIQDKFNGIEFDKITTVSFDKLKEQYYYTNYNEEVIKNNISTSNWKKYSKIGDIEKTIKLKLVKASYEGGVISLRYKNGISKYVTSMQLSTSFKDKLVSDGYKQVVNGDNKCIYENKEYQIIIMDEFDYLIVVMVKK